MFRVGQQFGIYTLIQQLGRGGFGEVWLAERRTKFLTTQVAVKLPLDDQVDHAAIEQEAQLWARASGHANVLPIIEANEHDGQILIVSEYAADGSLESLLRRNGGALAVKQAVQMTIGILKGLEFLHSRQIIHRDIKPANVLLQGDTPRLADFGISRVLRTTSQATNPVGTPYYMAPEAFQRKRNPQTDVWSVGVMLYQMFKGELPFFGDNITDVFGAIKMSEPAPLPDLIHLELQRIVGKALSKNITSRYQTAREMRDELDECWRRLSHPAAAQPQVPSAVTKEDNQRTIIVPVSSPNISKPFGEIEKPNGVAENHSGLPPASQQVKARPKRLYFSIPAVMLLLVAIVGGVGYLLINGTASSPELSNKTDMSLVARTAPSETADALLIPFRKADRFGFSDVNKNLVIEAKYHDVSPFSEGLARVTLNGKSGFIDEAGKKVIPPKYDEASSIYEGLASVKLNDKWGFIDKTGAEVIPLTYDFLSFFSEGLAEAELNGKSFYIDKAGKGVMPPKYHETSKFIDGLARVSLDWKYGFIDKEGKEVIPLKYKFALPFNQGLAIVVTLSGKYGLIDNSGKEVIPLKYDDASQFSEGLAYVKLSGKCGFIDKTGKVIIPLKYDEAVGFSEGLATIKLNHKRGFIDTTGKEVIPPKYDWTQSFHEGLAEVNNGKWGFIDKMGKEVIPLKYELTSSFDEGLAKVQLNDKEGFIDKTGKAVIPLKYDQLSFFSKGLAKVRLNGKEFYIDRNGTEYYEP